MRTLIHNHDLKTLFTGVAGMAAAGLMTGMVMQPNLDPRQVEGPQILMGAPGPRADQPAAYPGPAVYKGRVPDYVSGADWTKPPPAEPPQEAAAAEEFVAERDVTVAAEPPLPAKQVAWREPPREAAAFPSMSGDIAYASELPAPPPPPDEADED
jgi:hypothetical protein